MRAAVAGAGGVLVVRGEAGIGKSALVRELVASLGPGQAVVGHCEPTSYTPLRALSEIALGAVEDGADPLHPSLALHARTLDVLLGRAAPGAHGVGDDDRLNPVALAACLRQLVDLAPRVVMVVVEDLHWADPLTCDALLALGAQLPGRRLVVCATARPAEDRSVDVALDSLLRQPANQVLDLEALTRGEATELVRHLVPECDERLLREVVERSEGIPLAVEELVRAAALDTTQPTVPESVVGSVSRRLEALPQPARRFLRTGALLGPVFDSLVAGEAAGLEGEELSRAVTLGRELGLVDLATDGRLGFRHALVHAAVDGSLVPPERAQLAQRLMGRMGPGPSEELARLAEASGDLDSAARHLLGLAAVSLRTSGPRAARALAVRALELARATSLQDEARLLLLEVAGLIGDVEEADRLGAVLLVDTDPDDSSTAHRLHVAWARAHVATQQWSRASDLLAKADRGRAETHALAALAEMGAGRSAEAEVAAREALATAAGDADDAARCEAYEVLGRIARQRDLDEAQQWFRRASATAHRGGQRLWRARALHELATISQLRDITVDDLLAARDAAVEAGSSSLVDAVDFHLSAVHGVRFEVEPALEAGRRLLASARARGARSQEAWAWALIGQAHAAAGHRTPARAAAAEAVALAGDDIEVRAVAVGTCHGLASLLAGDRSRALDEMSEAVALLRHAGPSPLPPWYLWPLVQLAWTTEGESALDEGNTPALRVSRGVDGLWHLGAAVVAGRRGGDPHEHLSEAERLFAAVPGFEGYAHLGRRLAAEAALVDGWGAPLTWLADTERWASARGLDGLANDCRALARRSGAPQRRRGRGSTEVPAVLSALGVTSREADVLVRIAQGAGNQAIADELYLSQRTVKTHVENLLRKTGRKNRTELAALAHEQGLAPD